MGRAIARRTSGGTGVGPGAKRYRFNIDRSSFDKPDGGQLEKEAVRYHLQWESVKKSACTTDDVFRTFLFRSIRDHSRYTEDRYQTMRCLS
jgi:hypothetical protein